MVLKRAAGRGGWKAEGLFHDVSQGGLVGWGGEWSAPVDHLVDEDTEGPPIDGVSVGPTGGDFGGDVLVGPDERVRPGVHRFGHEEPV